MMIFQESNIGFMAKSLQNSIYKKNNSEISRKAKIGKGFSIGHAVGIVIGPECVIGDNVAIFQNVTLGVFDGKTLGMPTLKDGVFVYAGAVIAGPITIGRDVIIGANSTVTVDVPDGSTVVGHNRIILNKAN